MNFVTEKLASEALKDLHEMHDVDVMSHTFTYKNFIDKFRHSDMQGELIMPSEKDSISYQLEAFAVMDPNYLSQMTIYSEQAINKLIDTIHQFEDRFSVKYQEYEQHLTGNEFNLYAITNRTQKKFISPILSSLESYLADTLMMKQMIEQTMENQDHKSEEPAIKTPAEIRKLQEHREANPEIFKEINRRKQERRQQPQPIKTPPAQE